MIETPLSERIDALLSQFGGRRLLIALIEGLLRRRKMANKVSGLSPRMLRDIGLPSEERPSLKRLSLWDLRV